MYDTVNFYLKNDTQNKTDFLAETSLYLTDVSEHYPSGKDVYLSGKIENLGVFLSADYISIKNQSLCKWFLNDNVKTLQKKDVKQAIQKISDLLHLDFSKAGVNRIDIATNLIMKYPENVYFEYLGALQYFKRFEQKNSLYYNTNNKNLVFYNKIKEQKNNVADIYKNRNLLRYELRIKSRLKKEMNQAEIKASDLYNEKFYITLIDKYLYYFKNIQKIPKLNLNIDIMDNVKSFKNFFYLFGLKQYFKTPNDFDKYINLLEKKGELKNKMQKSRLKKAVKKAFNLPELTTDNEIIKELEKKVKEATSFYR